MRLTGLRILVGVFVLQSAAAQTLPRIRRHEGISNIPISFGTNVANVGDVNLDGVEDYVVGSPDETLGNPQPVQFRGVVRVYSGATGAVLHTFSGVLNFDRLGWSVGGGGDIDNDGVPDIVVGLPFGQNTGGTGHVRAYSGLNGFLIWQAALTPVSGYRVANAGDVNGDGHDDVVTSSGTFGMSAPLGYSIVHVLSGTNGFPLYSIPASAVGATSPYDSFGIALGGGKDFSGDGVDDFLVGFSSHGGVGNQHGSVIVFSGATGGPWVTLAGAPTFSFLGESLGIMGDLDGDGTPEIVAGGSGNGSVNVPGIVRVYSGSSGFLIHSIPGAAPTSGWGGAVAGGRDLDGDGFSDFVTSTPDANASGPPVSVASATGAVYAFSGVTGNVIGIRAGSAPGNNIGGALAMVGDTNGDGFGEIVCASSRDETALGADGGSVELYELTGFGSYGLGNGILQLSRINGPPGALSNGLILVSGATPMNPGILAADLVPANGTVGNPPLPLFLALSPALLALPIVYDASGFWGAGLDLRQPQIAGVVVYTQAFELGAGGIAASGGLELLFGM